MLNNFSERAGICAADLQIAFTRSGVLGWLVLAGSLALPFALARAIRAVRNFPPAPHSNS
jgi:hypothetical protein